MRFNINLPPRKKNSSTYFGLSGSPRLICCVSFRTLQLLLHELLTTSAPIIHSYVPGRNILLCYEALRTHAITISLSCTLLFIQ